ncbi:STAS domain-containing protein [Streptomyces sp. NPDC000348]|uniref:STAS domain-containing protein n=1 Tax=Streptomyces sp. NPDC000348 TaxID=3364538 RepID=UPI00368F10F1
MPDHRDDAPATADTLTVHTAVLSDGFLLTLTGTLDHLTGARLTSSLRTVLQTSAPIVWLELSGLSFIDSTGLTCLLRARRAVSAAGGHLALIAPSRPVQRMPALTGIGRILPVHPDHRTARAVHGKRTERHDSPGEAG